METSHLHSPSFASPALVRRKNRLRLVPFAPSSLSKSLPRPLRPRSSASSPASTAVTTSGSPEQRCAGGAVPNQLATFLSSLILPCEQAPPLWGLLCLRSHHRIHLAASFSLAVLLQLLRAIRWLLLDEADMFVAVQGWPAH
ncbi:hypothetical protein PVAP13_9NG092973 [Panicum virgatum]|uniref:Uncharacterized protein n=1 Tax=Panicum virgatum TaxID=38727 RepID=A0A8T0MJ99_PANVG|nr:hypothetical protein PVAP13_9NG092973 [Panicum virgatum]